MKVEVAVLDSPSIIVLVVSGRKATLNLEIIRSEPRSCVKVKMAVQGSLSLIVLSMWT